MEELKHYRKVIRELIEDYARNKPSIGDIEVEMVLDERNDHYELIHVGWHKDYRVHGAVLHIDIRGGKVWIQHDGTDDIVAERLVEAGIPKDRIVLAFKPPEIRPHTGYAVA
jgi:ketopantoate reductase